MAVQAGDVLAGKYRVERVLAEGGMGTVVAATHLQLGQRVALKFMLPRAQLSQEGTARFQREARAASMLKSEHVARVLDVGTLETGAPYIVMEYLEGQDLARLIKEKGALAIPEAADCVLQACDGLAEAHGRGIVHRDLKPGNLFLTRGPDGLPLVKVLDFGISKVERTTLSMTKSSVMLGSPLYMSPEQMKSSRDVDPRTDIWSLGVILYEGVAGRVPFMADSLGALMQKVLGESPAPLSSLRQDVPAAFEELVRRCLEKDRARRFASVAELARALAFFAPPVSRSLAERIGNVLQASSPGIEPSGVSPLAQSALVAPVVSGGALAPASTTAGWGGTLPSVPKRRTGLIAGVACVIIAAVAAARWLAAPSTTRVAATEGSASAGPPPPSPPKTSQPAASIPEVSPAPPSSSPPASGSAPPRPRPTGSAAGATPRPVTAPSGVLPKPRSTSAPESDPFGNSRE